MFHYFINGNFALPSTSAGHYGSYCLDPAIIVLVLCFFKDVPVTSTLSGMFVRSSRVAGFLMLACIVTVLFFSVNDNI